LFGFGPWHEWVVVLVFEVHTAAVIEEDVEVGLGLAGWFDSFVGDVNGAVDVGETAL